MLIADEAIVPTHSARPGVYTISSLSTVINALFESGGPSKTGSMRTIQIKRQGKTVVTFDLYDFLLQGDKTRDLRLMPEDVIFIPPVGALVGIAGNVRTPAIFELTEETRLLDLIRMSGGLTVTQEGPKTEMFHIDLAKAAAGDLQHNVILRMNDYLLVRAVPNGICTGPFRLPAKSDTPEPTPSSWERRFRLLLNGPAVLPRGHTCAAPYLPARESGSSSSGRYWKWRNGLSGN